MCAMYTYNYCYILLFVIHYYTPILYYMKTKCKCLSTHTCSFHPTVQPVYILFNITHTNIWLNSYYEYKYVCVCECSFIIRRVPNRRVPKSRPYTEWRRVKWVTRLRPLQHVCPADVNQHKWNYYILCIHNIILCYVFVLRRQAIIYFTPFFLILLKRFFYLSRFFRRCVLRAYM